MAKNLMPEIAKLLGVKIGEQFRLHNVERGETFENLYYLNEENGLMCIKYDDGRTLYSPYIINSVFTGKYEVVKLPWEPKYEEQFYTYIHNDAHNEWLIEWLYWYGTPTQLALKQLGMVFKTEEEAEKARPEIYKKLTGKDWK